MRERARAAARPLGWAAIALVVGFVIWTRSVAGGADVPEPVEVLAVIAVIFAARLAMTDHDGWAFAASAIAIAATVGSIFIDLYPNVMVSSTNAAYNLTVNNAASGSYALKVMTIVAVIFFPLVLLYQGWSFHVFRGRLQGPAGAARSAGGDVIGGRRRPAARIQAGRMTDASAHRVVIVGGGFGGLFAAKFLRRAPVQVTLIDRTNHHTFQPLLYQLATGILSEGAVAPPLREVLAQAPQRPRRARGRHGIRPASQDRHRRQAVGDSHHGSV